MGMDINMMAEQKSYKVLELSEQDDSEAKYKKLNISWYNKLLLLYGNEKN
jgi:hypothetical protein